MEAHINTVTISLDEYLSLVERFKDQIDYQQKIKELEKEYIKLAADKEYFKESLLAAVAELEFIKTKT